LGRRKPFGTESCTAAEASFASGSHAFNRLHSANSTEVASKLSRTDYGECTVCIRARSSNKSQVFQSLRLGKRTVATELVPMEHSGHFCQLGFQETAAAAPALSGSGERQR
jgi:hypothetical protein